MFGLVTLKLGIFGSKVVEEEGGREGSGRREPVFWMNDSCGH